MLEHQSGHELVGQVGRVRQSFIVGRLIPNRVAGRGIPGVTTRRVFLGVVGLVAVTYLLALTPVVSRATLPDPAAYVGAARNITEGRGITLPFVPVDTDLHPSEVVDFDGEAPLFQYSPGLPVVLATGHLLGQSPISTDRIVNLVSLGFIASLVAWAVLKLTDNSYVAATLSVFALLTTFTFVLPFMFVTTEAMFSALLLAALAALAGYVNTQRTSLAWAFVVLAAASGLTRFVGVSVAITGVIAIALWYPALWRGRVGRALLIGGGAVAPIALWMLGDALAAPGAGQISFHPPDPIYLSGLATSTLLLGKPGIGWADWLRYLTGIASVIGVTAAAWVTLSRCRKPSPIDSPANVALMRVGFVSIAAYSAILLISRTFLHNAPSQVRYLQPLFPLVVVIAAVASWRTLCAPSTSRGRSLGAWVLAAVLLVFGVWHVDAARQIWKISRAARPEVPASRAPWASILRSLPQDAVIFTNAPHVVEQAVGRFAVAMPPERSIWSGETNRSYRTDLAEIGNILCTRPGAVVLFGQFAGFEADKLDRIANLEVTDRLSETVVLGPDAAYCATRA